MISEVYNSDCMEGMKQYPDKYFDLALCDPPYQNADAIGLKDNIGIKKQAAKRTNYKQFDNIAPTDEYWQELKRVSKNQIVWGGNYFGLSGGVIVWQKNGTAFGEGEIAICSTHKSVRFFEYTWNGMIQQDMKNKETRIHPTQKPIKLYSWIYHNYLPNGGKVIDTHGGSMSNVIAALDAGNIEITCFEIDKDYYLDAKKRIENYLLQGSLFKEKPQIIFHK